MTTRQVDVRLDQPIHIDVLEKYDQLKHCVSNFFNAFTDDQTVKDNALLSGTQQHLLHLQETFFKSKIARVRPSFRMLF